VKTARRDLESLSAAGLPVSAQPGRGGGRQPLGGGRTDLSGLNAAETRPRRRSSSIRQAGVAPRRPRLRTWRCSSAPSSSGCRSGCGTRGDPVPRPPGPWTRWDSRQGRNLVPPRGDGFRPAHVQAGPCASRHADGQGSGPAAGFDLAQAWREAVAPLELRRQLAEIGAQLVEAYTKQS
jgi:hypothetical protein